jgi:hypothetical protein
MAARAAANGWAGVVVNGAIRDVEALAHVNLGWQRLAPTLDAAARRRTAGATCQSRSAARCSLLERGSPWTPTASWFAGWTHDGLGSGRAIWVTFGINWRLDGRPPSGQEQSLDSVSAGRRPVVSLNIDRARRDSSP